MQAATSAGIARAEAPGLSGAREKAEAVPAKRVRRNGNQRYEKTKTLTPKYGGKYMMELADVRNALENTATKLADFRGSL